MLELLLQKKDAKNECERRLIETIIDVYCRDFKLDEIIRFCRKFLKTFDKTIDIELHFI